MKRSFKFIAIFLLGLVSSQVNATNANVGTYNLILKNDLSTSSDIEGRSFIAGDILNATTLGLDLQNSVLVDAVTVIGDINGTINVERGNNIVYSSDSNISNATINLNGNRTGSEIVKTTSSLQNEFDAIWNSVEADSAYFAGLDANAEFNFSGQNQRELEASSATDLTVYNISTDELNGGALANGEIKFSESPTVPVVINVDLTGLSELSIGTKVADLGSGEVRGLVLWNFFSTDETITNINFSAGWQGSILAPYANIVANNGQLEGGVAALSYTGTSEIHNDLYTYNPPTNTDPDPVNEVPEPTGIAMMGLGLLLVVRRKLKNNI